MMPFIVDRLLRHAATCGVALACLLATDAARAADPVWITHAQAKAKGPAVVHFRKALRLDAVPAALWVHVSADNRYTLYVNGARAGSGPSASDLAHWRYRRIDIAPLLKVGDNAIAAVVWNFTTPAGPMAQISARTGFYFNAEAPQFSALNSGSTWMASLDPGRVPTAGMAQVLKQFKNLYYAAGSPETVDAAKADWNWETGPLGGERWQAAVATESAGAWTLSADPLPAMRHERVHSGAVVRTDLDEARAFPQAPVTIPAGRSVRILLDRGDMVAAYPELRLAGGRGARVKMTYAEALYDADNKKGHRDEVGQRRAKGIFDTFIADGERRLFAPLHWRVWRFLELDIETGDSPLTLEALTTYETGYPFRQIARFESDDPALNKIWQIGWRTAQVDAHDTYMDSAYWEQLQYTGDTRLQALISYAVSGDDRLAVNAIDAIGWSGRADGPMEGAYPSRGKNDIPPFSLLWVAMLNDYHQRLPDPAVVVRNLPRARQVLAWYGRYLRPDRLLGKNPGWNFVDWVGQTATQRDVFPTFDADGASCLTTLAYLGALRDMAELESAVGDRSLGHDYMVRAASVTMALRERCWSAERALYADDPSLAKFSQHANALAVLYDVATPAQARDLLPRVVSGDGIAAPKGVTGASYYFSWYLVRAFAHAGMERKYFDLLKTWRDLLKLGYTTWPEEPGDTRSDTHAWSAHPTADLLGIVAGVQPGAPGYRSVRVAPQLGHLKRLHAVVQTPSGPVTVDYTLRGKRLIARVIKPAGLPGEFVWNGKRHPLRRADNNLVLGAAEK